jgi:hypothetical protein
MNPKRAAKIRKEIYEDGSPRVRQYRQHSRTGQIIADPLRIAYQHAKKAWTRRKG